MEKRSLRSPKSRSGCQRCKCKRIKCDETKPTCGNCKADGADCPGYNRPLRWSRKHEMTNNPTEGQLRKPQAGRRRKEAQVEQSTAEETAQAEITSYTISWTKPDLASSLEWLEFGLSDFDETPFQGILDVDSEFALEMPLLSAEIAMPDFQGIDGFIGTWDAGTEMQREQAEQSQLSLSPKENETDAPDVQKGRQHFEGEQAQDGCESHSTALLHTFYRLTSPSKTPMFSDEVFVTHFFKHVCRLYSCFDSAVNPLRILIADYWNTCPTIYLTIQSMAVGHLANWYPYMAPLGRSKRSQAWQALQQDLQLYRVGQLHLEKALLSLMLLGLSSGCHHSSNLGLQYICIARNLIQHRLQGGGNGHGFKVSVHQEFFTGAFLYWEMLVSFIDPVSITPFSGHGMPELKFPRLKRPIMPHPWTGIVSELQFALAEIGRVLRRQRKTQTLSEGLHSKDQDIIAEDERWAASLEEFLRTIKIPTEDQIAEYDDQQTSHQDLIHIAQAYQLVGLLEVYRLYPTLLFDCIEDGVQGIDLNRILLQDPPDNETTIDLCTTAIALEAIHILDKIPLASAACRLQPLLLVATAGQLRIPDSNSTPESNGGDWYDQVLQGRYVVEERMLALSRKFPQKPLLRMMDIVKEIWHRLDVHCEDPHWIDIINETGWQTILG